ncbi:RNA polymerase sigma factor [Jannaschia sp. R86511]|uniref:RNA polymerase sigma factor n=1 Tax=Jannaschia sp. R86511 TaxID=3093853 RepID=UPI0036D2D2FB
MASNASGRPAGARAGAADAAATGPRAPGDPLPDLAVLTTSPRRHDLADRSAACFRRWCDGDPLASAELVALLTPTLWHTARAYRVDAATAEDVVQNAWMALARRRDQVRDPQAVLAWLLVTVRRDAARTAAAARVSVADPEPLLSVRADPAPGPAATVLDDDRARRLWDAVGRLSERCQRLLRVVAFSDRPDYASLSVDLGMPMGSIGPTRGRCLKKLREHLGEESQWSTT